MNQRTSLFEHADQGCFRELSLWEDCSVYDSLRMRCRSKHLQFIFAKLQWREVNQVIEKRNLVRSRTDESITGPRRTNGSCHPFFICTGKKNIIEPFNKILLAIVEGRHRDVPQIPIQ